MKKIVLGGEENARSRDEIGAQAEPRALRRIREFEEFAELRVVKLEESALKPTRCERRPMR
eukprot:6281978-Pyramimonas_sp.AAC.1